jgi:hypothetical protein
MKYVPSIMIGLLSRSAGSTTASHNRNGAYFRTRAIPVNPNTPLQSDRRASFAGFAQLWRGLTDAQRASWTALGTLMVRSSSLGESYALTGLQAYESVNKTLDIIGQAALTTAPAYTQPAAITSITVTATSV